MKSTQEIFVRYFTGSQILKLDCDSGYTTKDTHMHQTVFNVGEFYGILVIPL